MLYWIVWVIVMVVLSAIADRVNKNSPGMTDDEYERMMNGSKETVTVVEKVVEKEVCKKPTKKELKEIAKKRRDKFAEFSGIYMMEEAFEDDEDWY